MKTLKQPLWKIYMDVMLKAGFKERWNLKGESQAYWVLQILEEYCEQNPRKSCKKLLEELKE